MAWFHRQPFFLFFGAEISLPLGAHRRADRGLSGALQRLPFSSWLMFFYVSVTLLLLAHVPPAARWLGWFAWPGRAALTSYFIQIVLIDLAVSRYGFGLGAFPAWVVIPGSVATFLALIAASRWWFARYRFGPLE